MPMYYSPSEVQLWINDKSQMNEKPDDRAINERYSRGEGRIVIETNREKLPGFVAALKQPGYMDLRPFYQRRPRWNVRQQSLLIESFIMNIPVPPVFLYEKDFNSYEVMDGQQRITALRDFYENAFALKGLETWPELNGRFYRNLPDKIKAGVDRRSITSIVLLKESTESEEEASSLRETVFERLNTGGVELARQEIRNALYRGHFNSLLDEISQRDDFRDVWGLPRYVKNEIETNPEILNNSLFAKMGDMELILRFFALRHAEHYRGGMQGFLDLYMRKAIAFNEGDAEQLREVYLRTLDLGRRIFGEKLFRPYDVEAKQWENKPHKAFHDAVMIGLLENLNNADFLVEKSEEIVSKTAQLFAAHPKNTFTGQANTKADIQARIRLFSEMLKSVT